MNGGHFSRRGSSAGFTVTELLVVIAVVAIWAAVSFPVISRVRDRVAVATRLSTQRQMLGAIQMYTSDQRQQFPYPVRPGDPWSPVMVRGLALPSSGSMYFSTVAFDWINLVAPDYAEVRVEPWTAPEAEFRRVNPELGRPPWYIFAEFMLSGTTGAAPRYFEGPWTEATDDLRPTRVTEVASPSQKILLVSSVYRADRYAGWTVGLADGSAREREPGINTERTVSRPFGLIPVEGIATPGGLRGRDIP
ncbi:MAG: type II secretion system protein [Phycisphaerales bacterium]|nr:type II secretion system protein [Phycisphaerales bacterium]